MSDPKENPQTEKPEKKAKKAPTFKLQHAIHSNWTLSIGNDEFAVVDGAVEVPEWHLAAAQQAGFVLA